MVDRALLASGLAAIRDAVARIRAVLPPKVDDFLVDRTAREIVILNLFEDLLSFCAALARKAGAID